MFPNKQTLTVMLYTFVIIIVTDILTITLGIKHCRTPPEWLDDNLVVKNKPVSSHYNSSVDYKIESESEEKLYRRKDSIWPDKTVKYFINMSTVSKGEETDKFQMLTRMAIKEYEDKTCIRFKPWNGVELDYVSIEKNNTSSFCGEAKVCKRGGYQYAQIGQLCFDKATFVHELGHTLCLSHEHERSDRDEFLSLSNCVDESGNKSKPLRKNRFIPNLGIYDYASQMHYSCSCGTGVGESKNDWWTDCGEDIPGNNGLSIMDADILNYLYDCQGCHRHRWIPLENLTKVDEQNMHSFGHADHLGRNVYICRSFYRGEVAVGTLLLDILPEKRFCRIPSRFNNKKGQKRNESVEVLTIPGGLSSTTGCGSNNEFQERSLYEFVNIHSVNTTDLMKRAVRAGNGWTANREQFQISFIAVGSLTWKQFELKSSEKEVVAVDLFGSTWVVDGGGKPKEALFTTIKGKIVSLRDFKVLVCK